MSRQPGRHLGVRVRADPRMGGAAGPTRSAATAGAPRSRLPPSGSQDAWGDGREDMSMCPFLLVRLWTSATEPPGALLSYRLLFAGCSTPISSVRASATGPSPDLGDPGLPRCRAPLGCRTAPDESDHASEADARASEADASATHAWRGHAGRSIIPTAPGPIGPHAAWRPAQRSRAGRRRCRTRHLGEGEPCGCVVLDLADVSFGSQRVRF